MTSKITSIDCNNAPGIDAPDAPETQREEPLSTPPTDVPTTGAAEDIDTDELEALLVDLKEAKKRTKAPPKKRVRKPKATIPEPEPEPEPIEEVPVPEPDSIAVHEQKPKRKYVRKPHVAPEIPPLPAQEPIEEPAKRTPIGMIEEMQRAERALRYQMRKNKMQTLVSQAF